MKESAICFIAFWMLIAFSVAKKPNDCPLTPCLAILYPPSCRSVTFFIHGKNQVCQGCDQCIEESDYLDDNGCPLKACTMQFIPKKCRREIYYVYQGRAICKDCPQDTCRY